MPDTRAPLCSRAAVPSGRQGQRRCRSSPRSARATFRPGESGKEHTRQLGNFTQVTGQFACAFTELAVRVPCASCVRIVFARKVRLSAGASTRACQRAESRHA
eukprot:4753005-Pleurochrysis_carterae.AAC.2